ncbi:Peptide chain release factor subunit 1 [uncultured archaeon]|nr:Peptide chain release factor subunit 1 [uncultured archaeon]
MSTAKQKRELAKLISGLKGVRGSGTELISVYIPAGYALTETSNRLKGEYGQAGNIKSKTTRNNVMAALDKIISYLKTFKQTPKNGLAIFAGNISKDPGKEDIQLFSVEPPLALQVNMYRCDSDFMLDPLIGQGRVKEKYGLVTVDGKDATIAILEGNVTKIVRRLTTTGPSKTTKGGSSAARYQRYVEELIENYYKRIGQAMDETLFSSDIRKVIVGGPGPVKDNFLKMKAFNYQFQILAVLDTGYVDDYGIQELAKKAVDVIAEEKAVKEKKLLERLFAEIGKGSGLAVYGPKDTLAAMGTGKIETLMLSEKLSSKHLKVRCANGDEEEIVVDPDVDRKKIRCPLDHAVEEVLAEKDLFDEVYDRAELKGIEVETISEETTEGKQFLAGFKGIGAILKYR